MSVKKIKAIASEHKKDIQPGGIRTNGNEDSGTIAGDLHLEMNTATRMFFSSPSVFSFSNVNNDPKSRWKSTIHHTGYAEDYLIAIGCDVPLLHRRIVFQQAYEDRRACVYKPVVLNPDSPDPIIVGPNTFRSMQQYDWGNFASYFQGTTGQDWQDVMRAPWNHQYSKLISDKLYTYNPKSAHGQEFHRKYWTKINKKIKFDDDESGNQTRRNQLFAGLNSPKVFVMDFFKSMTDTNDNTKFPLGPQYFTLTINAKNYWRE